MEDEPKFSCADNNKYYLGGQPKKWEANMGEVTTKNFKKPPVLCNNLCNNYNCTYTFYTEQDCVTTELKAEDYANPDFRTVTLYPHDCGNTPEDVCQHQDTKILKDNKTGETLRYVEDFGFDFDANVGPKDGKSCTATDPDTGEKSPTECKYKATTNLIVRGWGTFFELDRNYQSVKFNGYGNCAFFLYEKPWFQGERGHFRGYWTGEETHNSTYRAWNGKKTDKAGPGTMCRNINLAHFKGKTGSLETNDSCWENSRRTKQSQSGTWQETLRRKQEQR